MSGIQTAQEIKKQIETVFIGKGEVIDRMLITLFSQGHLLIEDVPGVGKTTLAVALAKSVNCDFGRIQCTPDTLPSDVTGVSVYEEDSKSFRYMPGAVMHQLLLVDEINRTAPKTQSALLEAMEERQITVDGREYPMKEPFMVIATQNPVEFLGTFPLPEAQLDRFFMKISIGYPDREHEMLLARSYLSGRRAKALEPVADEAQVRRIQQEVQQVYLHDDLISYVLSIVDATRTDERFALGASERGMLSLLRAAQASAYLEKRDFCTPDDIKYNILPILGHRVTLSSECRMKNIHTDAVLKEDYLKIKVPVLPGRK